MRRRPAGERSRPLHFKYYMFDWDDNILHMPTRIHLEKKTPRGWIPWDVSTAEFARIRRTMKNCRPLGNDWDRAFSDFYDIGSRGAEAFLDDTRKALQPIIEGRAKGAPSFRKFRNALVEGRLFAIITARSHSAASIRQGVEYFIEHVLTPKEKKKMIDNLRGYIAYFDGDPYGLSDSEVLKQYLDLCRYRGVTSPEFQELMGHRLSGAESPEKAKQAAIREFVEHAMSLLRGRRRAERVSIGFSDDDRHNLEAVEQFIRAELAREYPGVKFVVYDTSDPRRPSGRKIVIQRGALPGDRRRSTRP
ncbi:MAG: hypothetical protein NZ740_00445 [Kiritimatiellae bacterium]|nr:hypothetical protein [Kiritimatiellia bacterium]MDW8457558.1 hypothetical protein [Verrucomicrobiota bacterium]